MKIIPTLGPKVCKYYLHWAIWISRVGSIGYLDPLGHSYQPSGYFRASPNSNPNPATRRKVALSTKPYTPKPHTLNQKILNPKPCKPRTPKTLTKTLSPKSSDQMPAPAHCGTNQGLVVEVTWANGRGLIGVQGLGFPQIVGPGKKL